MSSRKSAWPVLWLPPSRRFSEALTSFGCTTWLKRDRLCRLARYRGSRLAAGRSIRPRDHSKRIVSITAKSRQECENGARNTGGHDADEIVGTDGIRGTANRAPMTAEIALKVGMAAGCQFRRGRHQHRVLIGKDTRLSCYMLESALTAGFISVGMDVILVGPMPTPAVAVLTRSMRCDLGVMLSASHNPFEDNGIKLFGPDGSKLQRSRGRDRGACPQWAGPVPCRARQAWAGQAIA